MARPSASRQPAAGSATGRPRDVRPQAPFPLQTRDGQIGVPISRPSPAPQWPLPESIIAPTQVDGEPFRPPQGNSQPPQRPPRPSRVPSILDASKVQDHTPVFQYRPRSGRESTGQELLAVPETPSSASRPSTLSSVGSIPDFPLPAQIPPGPPRRSVNLGPPPSARRGASSFYSNASFVSPIPEESPRTRSHTSFASSAAMPDNWGSPSPGPSPDFPDPIYGEGIAEEGYGDDDAEESRLVRNASIGKRAKPTLVTAALPRGADTAGRDQRPGPQPVQGPFKDGTGYLENSSSSGTIPVMARLPIGVAVTPDTMLNAYSSASADDPSTTSQRTTPSPDQPSADRTYSRFSAIRRPPRLDIDAVRKAEARGSLTSLPDLIRRATRLAASLEKGKRPASRAGELDDFPDYAYDGEKHRSGLSDMLAAFPPPAHLAQTNTRRSFRDSLREQVQSWPLPLNFNRTLNTSQQAVPTSDAESSTSKRKRRCCGLPCWGFILLVIGLLLVIAAAVVIPVEFLVIQKQNGDSQAQEDLQRCQQQLACANGGTNVVNEGVCSCSCVNGFSGSDCTVADQVGCATITLTGSDDQISIGEAIPRLINQAQTNFSIPLSAPAIISKLNTQEDLSCSAENALVTFNGRATRAEVSALSAQTADDNNSPDIVNANAAAVIIDGVLYTTITIVLAPLTTFTLSDNPAPTAGTTFSTALDSDGNFATTFSVKPPTSSSQPQTSPTRRPTATSKLTTTMTMTSGTGTPAPTTPAFTPDEDALDFARVAVLYILQEDGLGEAETAQVALQRFLGGRGGVEAARNVTVGGGRSVDLVGFVVDLGGGRRVGGVGDVGGMVRRKVMGGLLARRGWGWGGGAGVA
ncbi:hypothetical protein CHGG_06447 [Chaetomium globosum CBS 148.51]|uniref:EGF-like domain-containing protein n=1 Tax=Chaetomium globosum (strain ATCC 6205 / CBS 148.51 / DSM 1962 / NBRC 6347 / NRRL 1970) TaxID=306901 RepID=Q2H4G8_CHAGB|nr:uncharacterized protein CHGG_06447 [Chaetomium globosum CBS 148.51]EAQ89828.1 hypothetical protein CHGG_06447 [Chaetomium globosum CBS 148.51]